MTRMITEKIKLFVALFVAATAISSCPSAAISAEQTMQPTNLMVPSGKKPNPLVVVGEDYIDVDAEFDKSDTEVIGVKIFKVAPDNAYPQVLREVPTSCEAGEFLRIRFTARSKENLAVFVVFGEKEPPYESFFRCPVVLTPDWQDYALVFKCPRDIAAGFANLSFQMPRSAGHVEIKLVELEDWGGELANKPEEQNRYINPFAGEELDQDFLAKASANIEKIRKGTIQFKIIGQSGKPIPTAVVKVRQKRHKFHFGSSLNSGTLAADNDDTAKYKKYFLELFNTATPENDLKWKAPDWNLPMTPEQIVTWCQKNNLSVRGHNLLAPQKAALPNKFASLPQADLAKAMEVHIKEYASKFKGQVYTWDVLNEAVDDSSAVGGLNAPILSDAFRWVHEIDPVPLLTYNDFDILNCGSTIGSGKSDRVYSFISELLANNVPITAIGMQSHMNLPLTRGAKLWQQLDRFGKLGLPIEITEYDLPMPDDALQAAYLEEFMTAVFSHPSVTSFVMWGFWQGDQFQGDHSGELIKSNWTERPALSAYKKLVFEKWWSNMEVSPDVNGEGNARVFLGDYEIEVQADQKTIKQSISVDRSTQATNMLICVPGL